MKKELLLQFFVHKECFLCIRRNRQAKNFKKMEFFSLKKKKTMIAFEVQKKLLTLHPQN